MAAPAAPSSPPPTHDDHRQAGRYVLRFHTKRVEADYEGTFLTKGSSLDACCARGHLDVALTHSTHATHELVTEQLRQDLEIPLPDALVASEVATRARARFHDGLMQTNGQHLGPVLFLSDRARLNLSIARLGSSINGTVANATSGDASVPIKAIFAAPMPLRDVLEGDSGGGGGGGAAETATGAPVALTDTGAAVEPATPMRGELLRDKPMLAPLNFESVPLTYQNWSAVQAVVSIHEPKVYRVCEDGTRSGPVAVTFVNDEAADQRAAAVEPLLQSIYDESWDVAQRVVFAPSPNLTKSVMNVPCGYNASKYALSAAINDTPVGFTDATLEALFAASLRTECSAEEMACIHTRLARPDPTAAMQFAEKLASAASVDAAHKWPYKPDGGSMITTTGLQKGETEAWNFQPPRNALQSGDCEDSGSSVVGLIARASAIAADAELAPKYPSLRALGNSLGAFYVTGTCVLAANAGHADAADEHAQQLAGHAIGLGVDKARFLKALIEGGDGLREGAPLVDAERRAEVTGALFEALFPPELVARMELANDDDVAAFAGAEGLLASKYAHPVTGMQPLAFEGTTPASSVLYSHDESLRATRTQAYRNDTVTAARLAPNITRMRKALDCGERGGHAFYHSFVELGVSMHNPLFTSPKLRALGLATPHFRFTPPCVKHEVDTAGATPEAIAKGDFSAIRMWSVDEAQGAVLDAAHAEAVANVVPMRTNAMCLTEAQCKSFSASRAVLEALDKELAKNPAAAMAHPSRHIVSAAALIGNPEALREFAKTVVQIEGVSGRVCGLGDDEVIEGLAIDGDGNDVGRFVVVELNAPLHGA